MEKETGYSSILAIAAIRDDTSLAIQFFNSIRRNEKLCPRRKASFTLNRLQTFQQNGTDLTGTLIYSDKLVSVFGGHECADVPTGVTICDHLAEQTPPVTTLENRFATVSLALRTGGDLFPLLAARDGTSVKVNGIVKTTLSFDQFYEIEVPSNTFSSIETDEPILLVQFCKGTSIDSVTNRYIHGNDSSYRTVSPPIYN